MECQEEGLSLVWTWLFCFENMGRRMLKEYRMQVGRASVKLEFSEEKNPNLKSEVLDILSVGYRKRIVEEFEKYRLALYYESAPLAG